ncbi:MULTISPECIES: hypothetical protein [unclassified Endozoicomonas]|uniref:hypothetical protein n=1 Tax=unclassified Endozoicomonas TaxID=2644528 RepID=UPI002147EC0E|nr:MULTISPECIES: hypothetical protein [unclassified Endozoicomonas]
MRGASLAASSAAINARRYMEANERSENKQHSDLKPGTPRIRYCTGNFPSLIDPTQHHVGTLAPGKGTNRHAWRMGEALSVEARIAAYPYKKSIHGAGLCDKKILHEIKSWDTHRPLALAAGKAAGLSSKGAEGCVFDKKTGLTAYILRNPETSPPEVRIVFGSWDALKKPEELSHTSRFKKAFTLVRWLRNLRNVRRKSVPESFKQASELTRQVQKLMQKNSTFKGWTLKLSGYEKGGAQASYAAVSQDKVLPARCFSSEFLSRDIINSLDEDKQRAASEAIIHYQPVEDEFVLQLDKHDKFFQNKVIGKPVAMYAREYEETHFL